MKYFLDVEMRATKPGATPHVHEVSVAAEDGRALTLSGTDAKSAKEMAEFTDPKMYGKAEFIMYDAEETYPQVRSLSGGAKKVPDIKEWQEKLGSPTLPARPEGRASAQWVREAWGFLRHYAGEDLPTPPEEETETHEEHHARRKQTKK